MRHVILTCKNHPHLRWSCKEIAWGSCGYNGLRQLCFDGFTTGRLFDDDSGFETRWVSMGVVAQECLCPASDLVLAPEESCLLTS